MTKHKKTESKPLEVVKKESESDAQALARFYLRPSVSNALTIKTFNGKVLENVELAALIDELSNQAQAAHSGDLQRAESMLMVQANTLDTIFTNLAQRAARAEYMSQLEPYLRLALKAQTQCRATLETLAAIKNPQPVAFVKQANIAHNQQVNNASPAPRAREVKNQQTQLLEQTDGERLDFGKTAAAGGIDQAMETVGEVDGAEIGGG
jgi:hypothetical protein